MVGTHVSLRLNGIFIVHALIWFSQLCKSKIAHIKHYAVWLRNYAYYLWTLGELFWATSVSKHKPTIRICICSKWKHYKLSKQMVLLRCYLHAFILYERYSRHTTNKYDKEMKVQCNLLCYGSGTTRIVTTYELCIASLHPFIPFICKHQRSCTDPLPSRVLSFFYSKFTSGQRKTEF